MIKVLQYGAVFLLLLLVIYLATRTQNALYRQYRRIRLGAVQLWEYMAVDGLRRHLLVSHQDRVLVIGMDKDEVTGSVITDRDAYGIAVAPGPGKGFISHRQTHVISVFSLDTLQVTGRIEGGGHYPEALLYDAWSNQLFVCHGRERFITVIDAADNTLKGIFTLPGKPLLMAGDEKGRLFVQPDNSDELLQLDAVTGALLLSRAIAPGEQPGGLAVDSENGLLFCAFDGRLLVCDILTLDTLATVPIGAQAGAVTYHRATGLVCCACGEGVVWVLKQLARAEYTAIQRITTQNGSRTMVTDSLTGKLYLSGIRYIMGKKPVHNSFEIIVFGF